jgi:superfamily I DNA and/or RNA helicase
VDAFQGKEFDVVILSPVRSNDLKLPDNKNVNDGHLNHKFGHLLLPNRMCVALSRQRRLLIVVGDDAMFRWPANSDQSVDSTDFVHPVPGLPEVLRMCGSDHGIYTPATYKNQQ